MGRLAMACNRPGWTSGDDLPLVVAPADACVVHDATFRALWVVCCILSVLLVVHGVRHMRVVGTKMSDKGGFLSWCVVCGLFSVPACALKAASLSRFSDSSKPVHTTLFAFAIAVYVGPLAWSFLFSFVAPFLAVLPNYRKKFKTLTRRVFSGCALLCFVLIFGVVLLQTARADADETIVRSRAMFSCLCLVATVLMVVLSVGGWKLARLAREGTRLNRRTNSSNTQHHRVSHRQVSIFAMGLVVLALVTSALFLPFIKKRTWLVVPMIVVSGLVIAHVLLFSYSQRSDRIKSTVGKTSQQPGQQLVASPTSSTATFKVAPTDATRLDPTIILARSQLEAARSLPLTDEFCPPLQQPRALKYKHVAGILQASMFRTYAFSNRDSALHECTLNGAVGEVIEEEFIPAARDHFAACVAQAREMVPEMRLQYHRIRAGHLAIYLDTLQQIRQENVFSEFQQRSKQLTRDCNHLVQIGFRSTLQTGVTVSDLYCGAEMVYKRYKTLMQTIAVKTGSKFHPASQKGLMRLCEKLALTPFRHRPRRLMFDSDVSWEKAIAIWEKATAHHDRRVSSVNRQEWQPSRILDVVRGMIVCSNFTVMINVLRLVVDLDTKLRVTGVTGGIEQEISICRCKNRHAEPTSGGWADTTVNFHFNCDGRAHICELQLVHEQLYTVRQNMGAHETYNDFRATKELCEKLGANPEEGDIVPAVQRKSLVWRGARPGISLPPLMDEASQEAASQEATIAEQAVKINALEAQVQTIVAQNEQMASDIKKIASLEEQVARLETLFDSVSTSKTVDGPPPSDLCSLRTGSREASKTSSSVHRLSSI